MSKAFCFAAVLSLLELPVSKKVGVYAKLEIIFSDDKNSEIWPQFLTPVAFESPSSRSAVNIFEI